MGFYVSFSRLSFFVEFLLWLLLVLLFLPVLSVSPLSRFKGFSGYVSIAFRVFFGVRVRLGFPRRFLLLFFVFGCPWGGHGGALFQLWDVFSAEACTFDFDRQYGVLAVFSRFGGFQKHEKSDKKVLENLLFFALRKKRSGIDFLIFLGSLLDFISSPGLKK